MELPPSFALRDNNDLRAKGFALWKDFEPWAPQRLWVSPSMVGLGSGLTYRGGLNLDASNSKPTPPQLLLDQMIGFVSPCRNTQIQFRTVKTTPVIDPSHASPEGSDAIGN